MRIYHVLEKIENAIYNSRKIPGTDYALIKRDKILKVIEKTRDNLPEEMKRARWVSKENQRIIQEAQAKAGEIIREAENRSKELLKSANEQREVILNKEEVVKQAKTRSDEILSASKAEAESILSQAKEKSFQMIRKAEMTAEDVTYRANTEARQVKKGADEYAWKILTRIEGDFSKIHEVLKQNIEHMKDLRQSQMEKEKALHEARKTTEIKIPGAEPPKDKEEKPASKTD